MTAYTTKYEIIHQYCNHEYSRKEAAKLLGLSERQISRLKFQYQQGSLLPVSMRETANAKMHQTIIESKSLPTYQDMNISRYKQALKDDFSIEISYSALYNILKAHQIESPLKQNKNLRFPEIRNRESSAGALVHVLSLPAKADLFHLFLLDDATGRLLSYRLSSYPNGFSYFALLYDGFSKNGIPTRLCFHLLPTIHTEAFSKTMREAVEMLSILYEESFNNTKNLRRDYLIHTLTQYLAEADLSSTRFLVEFNKRYALRAAQGASFKTSPNDATLKLALSYHRPWHMNTSGRFYINKRNYFIRHDFLSTPPAGSFMMLHIHNPSVIYAVYRSQLYTASFEQSNYQK